MAITKETKIDQITVTEYGVVLYRKATVVLEDGNQIAKTYHRTTISPGQDLTDHPVQVVAIANAAWTPEVVAVYQTHMAELQAKMKG